MMMGSAPGCVPLGHLFSLQKDNNSKGAIKLLLIIAKESSDGEALYYYAHCDKAVFEIFQYQIEILHLAL